MDGQLASECFNLLRRQYSLTQELRDALTRTCVVKESAETTTLCGVCLLDVVRYLCSQTIIVQVLADVRLLLTCDIDEDEQETLCNHLKYILDSPVRFTNPGVMHQLWHKILCNSHIVQTCSGQLLSTR